jgi:DNA-binding winged helix-turn-helix (wHTH) protein
MAPSGQVAYRFNGFRVDPVRRLLFGADGEPIPLKPKVFDVLLYLVERSGELVDKHALLEAVWPHVVVEENNLNKAISTLRQAFGESPDEHRFIVTEPGRGFRFVASVETMTPAAAPALSETRVPPGKEASGPSKVLRFAAAAAIAVVVGFTGWFLRPFPAPEPKSVVRFSVPLPAEPAYPANNFSTVAVSPDGQLIAYVAGGEILLRNVGEREARPVQGTAETGGVVTPVFSPDGQWLAYVHGRNVTETAVKRVPIGGGTPVPLYEATRAVDFPLGLSWPTADTMLFANADGIVRIPANGGTPEVLVARGQGERFDSPQLLPTGEAVLFTRVPRNPGDIGEINVAQVVVQSVGVDDRTVVVEGGSAARYLPTGHLVYAQGTALFAIPFDPQARTVRGGPVQISDALRRSASGHSDTAYFDISKTGTLVTVPSNPTAGGRFETTLTWVDREGREEPFPVRADDYTMVRISPDSTKVALVLGTVLGGPRPAIWLFDLRTENLSLLTADPAGDDGPVWSADGRRVFFRSLRGDAPGVYAIELETGETKLLASSSLEFRGPLPWTISPDDRTLGLITFARNTDIATLSLADGELAWLLHDPEIIENQPSFSANGAWIAYREGPDDGTGEITIRPFPGVSRTRIPVGRGTSSVFSRDGSELFFFDGQGLSAVPVTYEPTLRVGAPQRLFETTARFPTVTGGRSWDVDPSGERFLMINAPSAAAGDAGARIDVVVNWFEELKRRVPTQ